MLPATQIEPPAEKHEPTAPDMEMRFLIHDVPWEAYVAFRDALEGAGTRMTYREGTLELMSPSGTHEEEKTLIARLLEAWGEANDVDLCGFGSTTYRSKKRRRGLEADECYSIGPKAEDAMPQLAIEVEVSSPLLDKLDVYAGLRIQEVWVWHSTARRLIVHRLSGRAYVEQERSSVVPAIDLEHLISFVRAGESHLALVKAYRASLGRASR